MNFNQELTQLEIQEAKVKDALSKLQREIAEINKQKQKLKQAILKNAEYRIGQTREARTHDDKVVTLRIINVRVNDQYNIIYDYVDIRSYKKEQTFDASKILEFLN